jgi:hypothetical protein
MSTFTDRFTALERLLDKRQSSTEGGWPQKLGIDDGPTTIVATAQALEILRIRGLEHSDPKIQEGLRYLAKQVSEQTHPTSDAWPRGRGEWSRFPAYALWGLMRYPASRHDDALSPGILFSYKWLKDNALPAGGWSQSRGDDRLWLPGTMVAVHALDRLAVYGTKVTGDIVGNLVTKARDHISENAKHKNGNRQMFWTQMDGGQTCPGATSLAVLTLARGSEKHRDAARAGINWLGANHSEWTQRVHSDDQSESRIWRILSFSLGLRALMHPCGERDINDPAVAEVVQHIDTLWNEGDKGWADGPGLRGSMSGSYAVISAVHTLKRIWPFDPFDSLGIQASRSTTVGSDLPRASRVLNVCVAERRIRVDDSSGNTIVEADIRGKTQWRILLALATRHDEAARNGATTQMEMTISIDECTRLGDDGVIVKPEAITKARRRLHKKLSKEARKRSQRTFVELIEDHTPPGTDERRLALEELDVRFVDTLTNAPPT